MNPKGKSLLLMLAFSIVLIFLPLSNRGLTASSSATIYVDPPAIADLTLTPGSTFSINISVSGVENLWGYTIVLSYNTTVLTITDYQPYDPFIHSQLVRLNDTAGWAYIYFTMEMGATQGANGTVPLVRIDFTADALGVSRLDLHDTKLVNTKAFAIAHTAVDGSFTNIEVHNLVVTDVTASPARVDPGDSVSLSVTVANEGEFDESYNVSVSHDLIPIGEETDLFLGTGENTTRTFTWDTTGLDIGEYTVTAEVTLPLDNYPTDNAKSVRVRIGVTRDVAVTNVTASQLEASVGESVIVQVTIKNEGDFTETVTVRAKYDGTLIGTTTNQVLEVNTYKLVTFNWKTEDAATGVYTLSGEATIAIDDNPDNNALEGDTVTLKGTSPIANIVIYAAVAIVIIIAAAIILRYALRARKPK